MDFRYLSPDAPLATVRYAVCRKLPEGKQTVALPSAGFPFACPRLKVCGASCSFCPAAQHTPVELPPRPRRVVGALGLKQTLALLVASVRCPACPRWALASSMGQTPLPHFALGCPPEVPPAQLPVHQN